MADLDTTIKLLVLPLLLHVLLTLLVGMQTLRLRIATARKGEVDLKRMAVDVGAWPAHVRQWSNNFDNQFQVPMLWYAATAVVLGLHVQDMVFVALSWIFLAARLAHTVIHTGSNMVLRRLAAFLVSFAAVVLMWAWVGLRVLVLAAA